MRLTERLELAGIRSEREVAERCDAPAYIYFQREHPHALGYKQYQAKIFVWVDGKWKYRTFQPEHMGQSVPEKRADCVEQAKAWWERRAGAAEWVPGPFPDSWQLKETRDRMRGLLDDMGIPR